MPSELMHRGISIERRGSMWRWSVKQSGRRYREAFPSLERALDELDRVLDRRETERRAALAPALGGVTLMCLVTDWFEIRKPRLEPRTRRNYEDHIARDIAKIGELDARLVAADPAILQRLYAGLSPHTAQKVHQILTQVFELALDRGIEIERNPCKRATGRPVRTRKAAIRVPSRAEVEKILQQAQAEGPTWWLFVKLSQTLGTRREETLALQVRDIDFGAATVTINKRVVIAPIDEGSALVIPGQKGGADGRVLHVGPRLLDNIKPGLSGDPQAFLFPGRWGPEKPLHPSSATHAFKKFCRRAGLEQYHPHSLRHFVAVYLLCVRKWDYTQVAKWLGHANVTLTMDTYSNHVLLELQRQIGEDLDSLFDEVL